MVVRNIGRIKVTCPDKKQQKKSGFSWVSILIYMLIGAACGLVIISYLDQLRNAGASKPKCLIMFLLLFLWMYLSIILEIIIHEGGHLIFGSLTGYRFSSFRIFNFMWLRDKGRIRFKKLHVAGTGGQCLMTPPDLKDGKMPVMLYNFGGVLLNMITSVILLAAAMMCPAGSLARTLLLIPSIIGFAYALINGIPLRMGTVNNDGRNALDISRSPEAYRAFWIQMKSNELISQGIRMKDMPAEWFAVPSEEEMKNPIVATIGTLTANRLMDEHRFAEAQELMASLRAKDNGLVGLHRALIDNDRIFMELITQNRADVLGQLLTKEQKQVMKSMKDFPSILRTEYAYALLFEKDPDKAQKYMEQFEQCAVRYPYPSEVEAERELIGIAAESC